MPNKRRGYYTTKIGGKNRTMHFSMNFWSSFTEILGLPLERIGEIFEQGISLSGIRALIYSGLLAYDQENNKEIDYNIYQVGSWLDDFPADEINELVKVLLESKILGNDLNVGIKRNVEKSTKDIKKVNQ